MGGAENVLVELANELTKNFHDIEIITMQLEGPIIERVDSNITLVDLNCRSYREAVLGLSRHYDRSRPTVIITSLYPTGLAAIAAKAIARHKPKVIVGAHNSLRAKFSRPDTRKDRFLLKPLCHFLFPWADGFVAVSNGVAEELKADFNVPAQKVRVIYNPVVNSNFTARITEPVDHPWLRDGDTREFKTIVTVGRLVEQKGYTVLLDAFSVVLKSRHCRLIFIGAGPLLKILKTQAAMLSIENFVDFIGAQDNPLKYVKRAELFVLSSLWEGLPTVLIEALACGCPIVATNCPHGPSEILLNGQYGRLTSIGNPNSLALEILAALDDTHIDREALHRRANDFSAENATRAYLNYISNLIT